MTVTVLVEPTAIITLEEAKTHLRVDGNDEDTLIQALIPAATQWIEVQTGRAIALQTVEERLDEFDDTFELSLRPVVSLAGVYGEDDDPLGVFYIDADGEEQALEVGVYGVLGTEIFLRSGQSWPTPISEPGAVIVRYAVGYATVPAPIKAAALLMIGDLYDNRGTVVVGATAAQIPMSATVERLLGPYLVFF